jgi:hypothetical protein
MVHPLLLHRGYGSNPVDLLDRRKACRFPNSSSGSSSSRSCSIRSSWSLYNTSCYRISKSIDHRTIRILIPTPSFMPLDLLVALWRSSGLEVAGEVVAEGAERER